MEDFLPCRLFVSDEPVDAIAVEGFVDGPCYSTSYAEEVFGCSTIYISDVGCVGSWNQQSVAISDGLDVHERHGLGILEHDTCG